MSSYWKVKVIYENTLCITLMVANIDYIIKKGYNSLLTSMECGYWLIENLLSEINFV